MANIGYEVRQTEDRGRAVFATSAFAIGDLIFEETPLVSAQFAWNKAYNYKACEYCLAPLESAEENYRRLGSNPQFVLANKEYCKVDVSKFVKCPGCEEWYCSEDCRQEALKRYHACLCRNNLDDRMAAGIEGLIEKWKAIHLPPESTSIMLILKLLAMFKQTEDKEGFFNTICSFQSKSVNEELLIRHKMLGRGFEQGISELYSIFYELFKDDQSLQMFITPDAFKNFFALIGTNGQGIGTSSFAEWVKDVSNSVVQETNPSLDDDINKMYDRLEETVGIDFLNCEGSGLYVAQSKMNHSCLPNAEVSFRHSNHVASIVAVENIKPGDEICISYLDECHRERSRHSRQKELRDNYLFVCGCIRCIKEIDQPDVTSDEEEEEENSEDDMD